MARLVRLIAIAGLGAGMMAQALTPASATGTMDAKAIREAVQGKRIYLATPLGGELPMNYRPNGVVDANGAAIGLAKFFKPSDSGRWWIAGNQLCQKWQTWYDGRTQCFTLQKAGARKLLWHENNGDSGTARIAD